MRAAEEITLAALWKDRADRFGKRSVLNLSHAPQNYDDVTERQKGILLPVLAGFLPPDARRGLDFGCGPGRFTESLLKAMGGAGERLVIGYDICQELIDLAPRGPGLSFTASSTAVDDAVKDGKFDLVWLCLVIGGMSDPLAADIASHLERQLSDEGLLFFVEHVAEQRAANAMWRFRTLSDYRQMFPSLSIHMVDGYMDFGSPVAVMIGVKRARLAANPAVWRNYFRFLLRRAAWKRHRDRRKGPQELNQRRKPPPPAAIGAVSASPKATHRPIS